MTENSGDKQAAGRFRKGRSGNPAGKPRGTRNKLTVLAEKLMEDDAESVTRAVVDKAKGGDMAAARLVLDRIAPPRKGRPVRFTMAKTVKAADVAEAVGAIVNAMARGELTPDEAATIAAVLEVKRKALETVELEKRIAALEQAASERVEK